MPTTEEAPPPPSRFRTVVRILLAVVGLGVVVWLVRKEGVDTLWAVLAPALPWIPLATAFELGRVSLDALSSRQTLGRRGHEVPWLPLFASHLVAFAVMGVAPAGRAAAEIVKASLLSRWIGGGAAAAMGTANQANVLISSGTYTLLCAAAAYVVTGGFSMLTWAILLHFVVMNVSGIALRAGARYERFGAWLTGRFPSLGPHVSAFGATSRETPLVPIKPVSSMMLGRCLQAAHFWVLAMAVGIDPSALDALALHGVYLVIAFVAVLVPGQLGATEGGFSYMADVLGTVTSRAMAVALLAHAIHFLLVGVGFVVLAFWRSGGSPEAASAEAQSEAQDAESTAPRSA